MQLIWINLLFVFIASSVGRIVANSKRTPLLNAYNLPNKYFVLFVMASLALLSGLRDYRIGDTYGYMLSYRMMSTSPFAMPNSEQGFYLLQRLLLEFSSDPQILILTSAIVTNILIVSVLYRYSRMFELSIFMYITSGMYIVSMNGLRQFLAAAILFAATKYLLDGKWVKFILVVLFVSTIHQSALIFIPLYFFVRRKAWTTTTFALIVFAIIMVIGYTQFSAAIFSAVGDHYGQYENIPTQGANILRVAVQAAPLIIVFFGREKLRELFPKIDYLVNMSLVGFVFMIIATQNWIFARYMIYFGLYNLILISWSVKLFVKREQKIVYYLIIVLYLVYFYYENVVTLDIRYHSNYLSFLSPTS